jgi:hypothetical protein
MEEFNATKGTVRVRVNEDGRRKWIYGVKYLFDSNETFDFKPFDLSVKPWFLPVAAPGWSFSHWQVDDIYTTEGTSSDVSAIMPGPDGGLEVQVGANSKLVAIFEKNAGSTQGEDPAVDANQPPKEHRITGEGNATAIRVIGDGVVQVLGRDTRPVFDLQTGMPTINQHGQPILHQEVFLTLLDGFSLEGFAEDFSQGLELKPIPAPGWRFSHWRISDDNKTFGMNPFPFSAGNLFVDRIPNELEAVFQQTHPYEEISVASLPLLTPYTTGWYFQPRVGWMFANQNTFPYFYEASTASWLWLVKGPSSMIFYHMEKGVWIDLHDTGLTSIASIPSYSDSTYSGDNLLVTGSGSIRLFGKDSRQVFDPSGMPRIDETGMLEQVWPLLSEWGSGHGSEVGVSWREFPVLGHLQPVSSKYWRFSYWKGEAMSAGMDEVGKMGKSLGSKNSLPLRSLNELNNLFKDLPSNNWWFSALEAVFSPLHPYEYLEEGNAFDHISYPYTSGWYYQPDWGWLWTSKSTFPYVYRSSSGGKQEGWLYFREGTASPIYFYSYEESKWVTLGK